MKRKEQHSILKVMDYICTQFSENGQVYMVYNKYIWLCIKYSPLELNVHKQSTDRN